jgi:predicted DNA-binding protein (MmcQ/YjbR family)
MTRDEFDSFCGSLTATTQVIQWGNASVWKVGGKMFAICPTHDPQVGWKISFKCSDTSFELLCDENGIIPAPYLARGKWVQVFEDCVLSDDELRAYITQAHTLIAAKLTRAQRTELALD